MTTQPPVPEDLFSSALEICRLHRLQNDLDLVEVTHLRLASKACGRVAARMAQHRFSCLRLECRVEKVMGMTFFDDGNYDHQNMYFHNPPQQCLATKGNKNLHVPKDSTVLYKWDWNTLNAQERRRMEESEEDGMFLDRQRDNVKVRLSFRENGETADALLLKQAHSYPLVFELGDQETLPAAGTLHVVEGTHGAQLECEIVANNIMDGNSPRVQTPETTVDYWGSFRVKSIAVDFCTLVRVILQQKSGLENNERKARCISHAREMFSEETTKNSGTPSL